jgi:D-xylose transport system substrate-binding protein
MGAPLAHASKAHPEIGFCIDDLRVERWSRDRDYFVAAAEKLGAKVSVQSADASEQRQISQIENLISRGVDVIVIVPFNSKALTNVVAEAKKAGIKVVSYDRLILDADVDAYISFDNEKVGELQAQGVFNVRPKGNYFLLGGAPTDNNATLFREGYQAAIEGSGIETVGEEAVPEWDNAQGGVIFEQLLTAAGGQIDGVLVANDGLSLAAQAVLADAGLTVPTTGQDATVEGLRAILQGTQCMTVYKPVVEEANGAVAAAVALLAGEEVDANATIDNGNGEIPYVQAAVQSIFIDQVKDVVADGFVAEADLCAGIEDL